MGNFTEGSDHSAKARKKPTLIVLSHSYRPDPAAAGQYMGDACAVLAKRGAQVIVYTARNGYDDPSKVYPSREWIDGVEVRRVSFASFGKTRLLKRAAAAAWFAMRCLAATLSTRQLSGIIVGTAPPFIGVVAWLTRKLRSVPYAYWAMDLNPDQLVALGLLREDHPLTRLLSTVDKQIARDASVVVALDRFMAERLSRRGGGMKLPIRVIPPWSRDPVPISGRRSDNPFRLEQGWGGKTVFLYSGNHTTSNPLSTFLNAARRLKGRKDVHFAFVGSGEGKREIEEIRANGGRESFSSLPYEPTERLSVTLPAGDVHVASLGERLVGVIHPCKVYSAMTAGRPVLYVGPQPSHITDLIDTYQNGWVASHGDVDRLTALIDEIASLDSEALLEKGRAGQAAARDEFSRERLCTLFCDVVEAALLPR